MIEVASAIGKTPMWITKNFTYPQLMLSYRILKEQEFDRAEQQARLVVMVMNGWKRPQKIEVNDIESLKKTGMVEEIK